ncbi:hypothetical protein DXG03_009699 [Asterophora parasitica]|uniref:Protein kinase domain-containing protein n=1 Tax=Asterophora parasitica TaxID=117018 RepID=A0A9P7K8M2_9AGAR|nr:hypothetical protein DXG03_009699 [Asterophora parasitica]
MDLLDQADSEVRPGLPRRIIAYHDVQTTEGKAFSTFRTVRNGLTSLSSALEDTNSIPSTPESWSLPNDEYEPFMYIPLTFQRVLRLSQLRYPLMDRIHTQILMPLGLSIKYSKDLLELLACFLSCIQDDRHAHINGVVHRDVSSGNLLIFFDTGGKAVGRLMDYDHAKRALTSIHIPTEEHEPDMIEMTRTFIARQSRPPIPLFTEEAVVEASRYFDQGQLGMATIYAAATYRMRNPSRKSSEEISKEDLGWNHEDIKWPDFTDREACKGQRSGTLPYMSPEVLAGNSFFRNVMQSKQPFIHTSVHDVESFLWVLVHICLTRRGPGMKMGRHELDPNHKDYDHNGPLCKIVTQCFDGDEGTINATKEAFYVDFDLFKLKILDHFHPYFAPLKSLVRQWWETLVHAYKFRANEYYHIHDHILRLLKAAISDLNKDPTKWAQQEDTDREVKRREDHHEETRKLLHAMRTGSAMPADVDITSPTSPILLPQVTPASEVSTSPSDGPTASATPSSPTLPPEKRRRIAR